MAITPYKAGPRVMGSTAFKVGLGALTGGAGGAGMALLNSKNPGAGAAVGMMDKVGGDDSSAMDRRMENQPEDHESVIDGGIDALDHPDVPQGVKDAAAPVLFAAKHYGIAGLQPPDSHFDYLYQGQENA